MLVLATACVIARVPIGLLSGLSAVVCLLLIISVANNKIQGLAMVRALGMLMAGLPALPWHSLRLEPGLRCAAALLGHKAFFVASDHGVWWPYVVVGAVYNLVVAWPLFRRFVAKTT